MLTPFQNRKLRAIVTYTLCSTILLPPPAFAQEGFFRLIGPKPEVTAVKRLAQGIDKVEHHLDECGSIVIKTPDVWGESRLMRHRSDVETQLKARLDGFRFRINSAQATRDAAFLASAVALQEAIAAGQVNPLTGTAAPATPTTNNVNAATATLIPDPNGTTGSFVPRGGFNTLVVQKEGQPQDKLIIGIEPVIELDQLNRYLQHLNELRRLNEGDDYADTPGYALNLIRIPVSVLPGRKTQEGFGAEVQMTIDPYLSEEILPLAFKDFVINGVVDRLGFDVFQIAQGDTIADLVGTVGSMQSSKKTPATPNGNLQYEKGKHAFYNELKGKSLLDIRQFAGDLDKVGTKIAASKLGITGDANSDISNFLDNPAAAAEAGSLANGLIGDTLANINHRDLSIPASHRNNANGDRETLRPIALHMYDCLVNSGPYSSKKPRSTNPVPPNHRLDHGLTLPEVETLLKRETEAAYEFLSQPAASFLWAQFCTQSLARQIREVRQNKAALGTLDADSVAKIYSDFSEQIQTYFAGAKGSVTVALAWHVIVESALVNERLLKDMKETAALKNCPCVQTGCTDFFGPDPSAYARLTFNEYVKCKWPIHVFALDPVTQDQNVSDSFSQRREMQMAMAIAASNRIVGGQGMSRFVRRMEYDLETIDLNRTAVGFSHGDNTFGWRFFPRVQTPPVPSNLKVLTQDLLIGGQSRDSLSRNYKLESGIRECTALVVMPSFVPQVMVDVRTNWFRLAKHSPIHPFMKRKPDYEDSIDLSREVTELRELQTHCMKDAHLYRNGEVYRLCNAIKRLEDRLPLQTHNVSVPWENDLGGCEVFQSGTQVLGPEIHGWYGAPGILVFDQKEKRNFLVQIAGLREEARIAKQAYILQGTPPADANQEPWKTYKKKWDDAEAAVVKAVADYSAFLQVSPDTTIFLVGKNFSVLNCRVISGGVDVTETIQVINRNLMQVRIPSTVSTVTTDHDNGDQLVIVHLATPYGATSRLAIPVAGAAEASDAVKAQKAALATATAKVQKLSDRFPIVANWGNSDSRTFTVQGYFEKNGFEKYRFCPVAANKTPILVYQDPKVSPLPIPHPQGTFDENPVGITGQLLVMVEIPDSNKKQKFGPWELKDGNVVEKGGTTPLTANALYSRIHKGIRDDLPCKDKGTLTVTVTGYVQLHDDKTIIRLDDPITFRLEIVANPKSE